MYNTDAVVRIAAVIMLIIYLATKRRAMLYGKTPKKPE